MAAVWFIAGELGRYRWALSVSLLVIACASSSLEALYKKHEFLYKMRNYYGIYEVYDGKQMRTFIHGTTLHGVQLLEGTHRSIPIGYYSPLSAVGEIMIEHQETFKNVALIGLGAGTLAAYGSREQAYDFYELDPDVHKIAAKYFTYMDVSASRNTYIFGDARISLEKNVGKIYDAIIVDAFGGDSIPVHLVNKDVVEKYRGHLTEKGMIVFHATNRYMGLEPVLARVAGELGAFIGAKDVPDGGLNLRAVWVVMTWDEKTFQHLVNDKEWVPITAGKMAGYPVWTDRYSSILPILKLDMLIGAIWRSIHSPYDGPVLINCGFMAVCICSLYGLKCLFRKPIRFSVLCKSRGRILILHILFSSFFSRLFFLCAVREIPFVPFGFVSCSFSAAAASSLETAPAT